MTETIVRRRQRPLIVGLFVVLLLGVSVLCPAVALAKHKPILSGVGLAPAAFYGGAGSSGSTTLTYTLHRPSDVSVIVRDADGVTVRTLQPDTAQAPGIHALDWDGTDGAGAALPAGTYALEVTARSANGTVRSTRTVELLAPLLADVSVAPPSFYGGAGSTTLTYTLSGAANASVIVRDADDVTVRTLQPETPQAPGTYTLDWDGTDGAGAALPAGTYTLVISAGNWIGSAQSAQDVELVAPVLTGVGVAPASFYFGSESTTVSYTLTAPADASVIVRDANDVTVCTLQPETPQAAGTYTLDWDGTDGVGATLPAGTYTLVVSATTAVGSMQSTQTVELLAPLLADVSVAPTSFYGGAGSSGSTTRTYTLGEAATVSVLVRREHGAATVRTLQSETLQAPGTYTLDWDGTDGAGEPLGAGIYRLVVSATTATGSAQSTQTVELLAPLLTDVSLAPTSFYGGAGSSGSTTLTYTLSAAADASVIVRGAGNVTVRTLQPETLQAAGTYALDWDGTDGNGATLPAGAYTLVVTATTAAGSVQSTQDVLYAPTPVASAASLALDAAGDYVLRAVVENWSETLNGQTAANYYYDGAAQPWEYAATTGAGLTLYVGVNPVDREDSTAGGSVTGTSDAKGVADLEFPPGLAWYDAEGAPLPLYYSLKLTYGGSSRWYPAVGRYPLRPPVGADGHLQFVFMSDIQAANDGTPTPDVAPDALTSETGPYTAIPRLSRALGWAAALAGMRAETGANLVLCGGDPIERAKDLDAPDDGATQWRTLMDNEQTFGVTDEWSLSSLANSVAVNYITGNHDDLGHTGTSSLWDRWVYHPSPVGKPYYAFDQGDVHFVLLSTYSTSYPGFIGLQSAEVGGSRTVTIDEVRTTYTNTAQADWLIGALVTDKPWTVVVSHYPLFDSMRGLPYADRPQTTLTSTNARYFGERTRLLEFFAANGVDAVLQGHNHNYRRHVEKVQNVDGTVESAMTFITQQPAGGVPAARDTTDNLPYIDWVDLNGNGVPDVDEPLATAENSDYWDASAFGRRIVPLGTSGYVGTPDMFHATGPEYNDGVSFAYTVFETGTDGEGTPTLSMEVKFVTWNATTHAWNPWTVYDSAQISQVEDGMVAKRLIPD